MFQLYDISLPISPAMPVYQDRDEKKPRLEVVRGFEAGGLRETRVTLDTHTGTHVDAPLHVLPDGASVEQLDPATFLGPCRVLDLSYIAEKITAADLAAEAVRAGDFILCKTRNSLTGTYGARFVYIDAGAARYLVDAQVRGVGLDALGIERNQPAHDTHRVLLSHGIAVLEGITLARVPAGTYWLLLLPLALVGAEAAPARAVLVGPDH